MISAGAFSEGKSLPRGKLLIKYKYEYIGNSKKIGIPMYLNSKYIGEPQKIEFPMYLKSEVYWKYIGNRKYFLIPMYYHYMNESWYIGIALQ